MTPRLTAREREVLELIAGGAQDPEIAARLFISPTTVKSHVKRIIAEFGARTRSEAVAVGFRMGMLQ